MNCDRAGALLSAYLRDELTDSNRAEIQDHLDHCPSCRADLDLDRLIFELPRVEPSAALHNRIFSYPEFQEVARALRLQSPPADQPPSVNGRSASSPVDDQKSASGAFRHLVVLRTDGQTSQNNNGHHRPARTMQGAPRRIDWQRMAVRMAVAAAVLVLLLGSALMVKNVLSAQPAVTKGTRDYGLSDPVKGPLAAGNRVVYLHDGRLWSAPGTGVQTRSPLTATGVQVAPGWVVAPAAGPDRTHHVAYIDLKTGMLHFIQTDDSNDLLVARVAPAGANLPAFWQSAEGQDCLAGIAWAPDARQLAFVADPDGAGASLWLVNADGSAARSVSGVASAGALPLLPAWASDGLNLAYVVSANGVESLWNYAFDGTGAEQVVAQASPQGNAGDVVRGLFWTSDTLSPNFTWSASAPNSTLITGLWSYRFNQTPHLLRLADSSATFSAVDYSALAGGVGAWLVGQVGIGLRSIHADGSPSVDLASGQMIAARWAPDASGALYLTGEAGASTGALWTWTSLLGQRKVAENVAVMPLPAWSPDARQVLYVSNGQVFDVVAGGPITRVALASAASALSWLPTGQRVAIADAKGVEVLNPDGSSANLVDDAVGVSALDWTLAP